MFGHYPLWGGRPSQLNCSTMAWSSQISCWLHSSLPLNRLAPLYPTIAITVCWIGVYLDPAKDGVKIPPDWEFYKLNYNLVFHLDHMLMLENDRAFHDDLALRDLHLFFVSKSSIGLVVMHCMESKSSRSLYLQL